MSRGGDTAKGALSGAASGAAAGAAFGPWGAAVGGVVGAVGGALGAFFGGGGDEEELLNKAWEQYGNINLPTLEKVAATLIPPTELAKIQADPQAVAAQHETLQKLQDTIDAGGLTTIDKANLSNNLNAANARTAANRGAIRENAQARGIGGSGAELAMQLSAGQQDANTNANIGLNVAAQAQQRYLDTILNRGKFATDLRGQDWGEKSQVAQAQDSINRYNAGATDRANYYNAGLGQQQFENQMTLANARSNVATKQAQASVARSQRSAAAAGAITSGMADVAGAIGSYNKANSGGAGNSGVYTGQTSGTPFYAARPDGATYRSPSGGVYNASEYDFDPYSYNDDWEWTRYR